METIRNLFELSKEHYITIGLTNKYMLYIEGLNEDWVSLCNDFSLDKVKNLLIELNDYSGDLYVPIQNSLTGVTLDTSVDELKEKIFDLMVDTSTYWSD